MLVSESRSARLAAPGKSDSLTRLLMAAAVALCCAAPMITFLSRSGDESPAGYPIFQRLFSFNDHIGSLAMLAAFLLALALPKLQDTMAQLAARMGERPTRTICAAFVVLALAAKFVYMAHPLSMDEYAPWMQANAFARGHLAAQYPPELLDVIVPRQFQGFFIGVDHSTGAAISRYWPGMALLMTPFAWLNIEWCLNPAFGALTLWLVYMLARDATGSRTAGGWAMLVALASPQFTISSISCYAMPGELALNLLFLWLLLRSDVKSAFAAGLVGGMAMIMHNPAPHVLMAAPSLVWLAFNLQRWPRTLAVAAGYLPMLVLGLGWAAFISSMDAEYQATSSPVYQNIFTGTVAFVRSFLTLPDAPLLMARWYATWKMWIWACPGLLLVLCVPRRRTTTERLLFAGLASTFLFYLFVTFDQGHGWGYRYIHAAWAALPVIAGVWLASASDRARQFGGAMVAAGLLATPAFLWQTNVSIRDALSGRLSQPSAGDWVIFVSQAGRYSGDLVQNPPGQSRLLYLVSRGGDSDRALMSLHFPGAIETTTDQRGSAWRLPDGRLAQLLQAGSTTSSR